MTLKLPKDPQKSNTVQLMESTKKLWKSTKYRNKARNAMMTLLNALKAIVATNVGPTGRELNHAAAKYQRWLVVQSKHAHCAL